MKRYFLVCSLVAIAACAQQPPPPPMTYTVYFDYNSSQLGPAGREVVKLAGDAYKTGTPSSVQVTGYTDPSGSAGYNQRLSLRRANAVAAELQSDGVPQSALVVSGQGESSKEPTPGQDRRVDVTVGGPAPAS